MKTIDIRHLFDIDTWVKIEARARKEGKSPEAVALIILSEGVGLTHSRITK